MKLMYGMAMMALFIATGVAAQEKRDTVHYNGATAKEKVKLKKELGLTKKQAKTMKASNQEFKEETKTIKNDSTLSQQEKRQQLKKIHEAKQQKLDSLLTPEQKEKVKALRKEKVLKKKGDKTE